MNIYMSPHSGCYNHGCEAIVRSTVDMLKDSTTKIFLYSSDTQNDKLWGLDSICKLVPDVSGKRVVTKASKKYFGLKNRIFGLDRTAQEIAYRNKNLPKSKNAVWLSIGGDNYCYFGMQQILSEQLQLFFNRNIPCVLWGCSFEESLLSEKVVDELKRYSLITVRESLSYDILMRVGIDKNTVKLCSDPAFTLKSESTNWNRDIIESGKCIGINISGINRVFEKYEDAGYKNFKTLIEHLLKNTTQPIILIPHVIQPGNDDLELCKRLSAEMHNDRIIVLDQNFNCMQLKYIISKCDVFIGCRTHATIAAYSCCVPTLAVGYSTKAQGISKDIFGEYEDLLVDVRNLETDNDLLDKFIAFYEKKNEIKEHLQKVMPSYINTAYLAKESLKNRLCF